VAAGVVDDLGEFVVGQAVGAGDLEVVVQFVVGAQRDQDAQRDEAAVAPADSVPCLQSAEDTLDADVHQIGGEAVGAEVDLIIGAVRKHAGQLTKDAQTFVT
jgi:hypothetical protein